MARWYECSAHVLRRFCNRLVTAGGLIHGKARQDFAAENLQPGFSAQNRRAAD
jgi:hypothetical protein